jgi:hypothetical protein
MIINQDEKFTNVIKNIEGTYIAQDVFTKFIELYPVEWKQLKTNYSKFNRSKQFGRTIPLPKPEVTLKKAIQVWLSKQHQ